MGGPRIDYTPYQLPSGAYRCTCGAELHDRQGLVQHWHRQPTHHPRPALAAEKPCKKCGATLPLTAFGERRGTVDGRRSWCKACTRTYARGTYIPVPVDRRRREHRVSAPVPQQVPSPAPPLAPVAAAPLPLNPRLELALKLAQLGICPACHLAFDAAHAQCRGCTRWLCGAELDPVTRICELCADEWVEGQALRERTRAPQRRRRAA